jgi:hypothetical protein
MSARNSSNITYLIPSKMQTPKYTTGTIMRPTARLSSTDTRATNISRGDSGQISHTICAAELLSDKRTKKGYVPNWACSGSPRSIARFAFSRIRRPPICPSCSRLRSHPRMTEVGTILLPSELTESRTYSRCGNITKTSQAVTASSLFECKCL